MSLRMMILVVILVVLQISKLEAIQCYHCDTAANITCPGWQRPPIDSVKLDRVSWVTVRRCVTVKLADGTIIKQNIYPSFYCQEKFIKQWKMLLYSQWNQEVLIDCCAGDLCNAPSASAPCHAPSLLLGLATSWCLLTLLRL